VYAIPLFNITPDELADNFFPDGLVYDNFTDNQVPLAGFFPPDEFTRAEPVFVMPDSEFIFINGALELDMLLINPEENTCYLTFEIILADTGETLYQSYKIAPALRIENINLSRILDQGAYQAVLVMRAFDLYNFTELGYEKVKLYLIFE